MFTAFSTWRARVGVVLQSWRDHGKWRVRELLAHLGFCYACYSTEQINRPWDVDDLAAAVGRLSQQIAADGEVPWTRDGQHFARSAIESIHWEETSSSACQRPQASYSGDPSSPDVISALGQTNPSMQSVRLRSPSRRLIARPLTLPVPPVFR